MSNDNDDDVVLDEDHITLLSNTERLNPNYQQPPQQQPPTQPTTDEEMQEKNLDDASSLLETENGLFQQRMWGSFQSCAKAVAQVTHAFI